MILLSIIMTPLTIEAKTKDESFKNIHIYRLTKDKDKPYFFCKNAPFNSVCMTEKEYRRLLKKTTIENEYYKKKLELKKDSHYTFNNLMIAFLFGVVSWEVAR